MVLIINIDDSWYTGIQALSKDGVGASERDLRLVFLVLQSAECGGENQVCVVNKIAILPPSNLGEIVIPGNSCQDQATK